MLWKLLQNELKNSVIVNSLLSLLIIINAEISIDCCLVRCNDW